MPSSRMRARGLVGERTHCEDKRWLIWDCGFKPTLRGAERLAALLTRRVRAREHAGELAAIWRACASLSADPRDRSRAP